jgi:hypothetical protein
LFPVQYRYKIHFHEFLSKRSSSSRSNLKSLSIFTEFAKHIYTLVTGRHPNTFNVKYFAHRYRITAMGHRKVPLKTYMKNVMRIPPFLLKKKNGSFTGTQIDGNEDDDEYEDIDEDEDGDEDDQGKINLIFLSLYKINTTITHFSAELGPEQPENIENGNPNENPGVQVQNVVPLQAEIPVLENNGQVNHQIAVPAENQLPPPPPPPVDNGQLQNQIVVPPPLVFNDQLILPPENEVPPAPELNGQLEDPIVVPPRNHIHLGNNGQLEDPDVVHPENKGFPGQFEDQRVEEPRPHEQGNDDRDEIKEAVNNIFGDGNPGSFFIHQNSRFPCRYLYGIK